MLLIVYVCQAHKTSSLIETKTLKIVIPFLLSFAVPISRTKYKYKLCNYCIYNLLNTKNKCFCYVKIAMY